MTSLSIARRRLAIGWSSLRLESLLFVAVMAIATAALVLSYAASLRAEEPAVARVAIPTAKAAALIEATAGSTAGAVQATGVEAQKINASLPFNAGPVPSARPFSAPTGGTSYDRALTCLTQAVYYEAGFEPLSGRRAVAQVVLNRMRHPAFPKSVCGVVYQRNATPVCQFSFVCDGSLSRAPAAGAWAISRQIAADALAGYVEPSVGSATHYHADYVAPRWAPLLAKINKIGAHIFYRWPGAWGLPAAFTGRYIGEPSDPAALRPVLRAAVLTQRDDNGEIVAVESVAPSGPPIARASNDVGGLLDTSKGWTLSIPLPNEVESKTKSIARRQEIRPGTEPAATLVAAGSSAPAVLAAN
jgi:spore germination cell wall hydrolase CwlJ-like protein